MIPGIYGFFGEYRWLSNFWYSEVEFEGDYYPSTEHAYQAAKTLDPDLRRKFRFKLKYEGTEPIEYTPSCAEAKRMGSSVKCREDWEEVKVSVMEYVLRQKFKSGSDLAQKLIDTADLYLEETNHWGDVFWGVCNNKGKNVLGNLLMLIRRDLLIGEDITDLSDEEFIEKLFPEG